MSKSGDTLILITAKEAIKETENKRRKSSGGSAESGLSTPWPSLEDSVANKQGRAHERTGSGRETRKSEMADRRSIDRYRESLGRMSRKYFEETFHTLRKKNFRIFKEDDEHGDIFHCSLCEYGIDKDLCVFKTNDVISNGRVGFACTIRKATMKDIGTITNLCGFESKKMYGDVQINHLIESSYMQFLLENQAMETVAFIAVNDYPNPTYLPQDDWEYWMANKYTIEDVKPQNSLFLHFLAWNKDYLKFDFLKALVKTVFAEDPVVNYLFLVLPPRAEMCEPYIHVFEPYLKKSIFSCALKEGNGCLPQPNPYTNDLVVALREESGLGMRILTEDTRIDEELCKAIEQVLKEKTKSVKWLKKVEVGSKQRTTYTGLSFMGDNFDIGIATINLKVDLDLLDKTYDTFPLYGFRGSTKEDKWFQILSGTRGLECLVSKCIQESSKLLVDPNTQRCGGKDYLPSFQNTSFVRTIEKDSEETELGDLRNLDEKKVVENEKTQNYLDMLKVIGKNVHLVERNEDGKAWSYYTDSHDPCNEGNRISSKPLNLDYHGGSVACEIEFYDPPQIHLPMSLLWYIVKAFNEIPGYYVLMRVADDKGLNPVLHYFHLVKKRQEKNLSKMALYACHKLSVCGTFEVREMNLTDLSQIVAMSWSQPHRKLLQENILDIFLRKSMAEWKIKPSALFKKFLTLEYKCFVFTASDLIVGFAVVRPHHDIAFYMSRYNLEEYMTMENHSIDAHGLVRHLCINPLFKHLTRRFLRGVMKRCRWTTLLAFSAPCRLLSRMEGCSVIQEIVEWVQVSPRILPEKARSWDRRRFSEDLNPAPRGLHLLTYSLSVEPKLFFGCHLVVVGSGDVAFSFLEHLLLNKLNAKYGFRHVTLIANDGMQMQYAENFRIAVKAMIPWNGRHDQNYRDRCNIESLIHIVRRNFIGIDRERKMVLVEGCKSYYFDYLFLFCGTQFTYPLSRSLKNARINDRLLTEKKMETLKNVFTINNRQDAYIALNWIGALGKDREGQIIVYGACIEAISCVAGLLRFSILGKRIVFFLSEEGTMKKTSYIHSGCIMDAAIKSMKCAGVTVYRESVFLKFDEHELNGDRYIQNVYFKSGPSTVIVKVVALISYEKRAINRHSYTACKKCGLWIEEKLTIDSKFRTSDENIFAGGSMTACSSVYKTDSFNHEFYDSVEIGAEIAQRFWEQLLAKENAKEETESEIISKLVTFHQPLVIYAKFPEDWHYVRITRPGNEVISIRDRSLNCKMLQTGNPYDPEGPGLFQLILNEIGIIREVVCYRKKKIPVKDLMNIYGKHESLLNNLLCRFEGNLISNLYNYFNEPWATYIYNDKFSAFYRKVHSIYYKKKKLFADEACFCDFVAYALNLEKWQKILEGDEDFLENIFCYNPDLKKSVERNLITLIRSSNDMLITQAAQENQEKYKSGFGTSRLLGDFRAERGLRSLWPSQLRHIVPLIQLDKDPDEKRLFQEEKTVDLGGKMSLDALGRKMKTEKSPAKELIEKPEDRFAARVCQEIETESEIEETSTTETNPVEDETGEDCTKFTLDKYELEKEIEKKFEEFRRNRRDKKSN